MQPVGIHQALASQRIRIPLGARDRVDVHNVHRVDFFQPASLGLDHKEVDNNCQHCTRDSKDQPIEVINVVRDQCTEEADQEVEQPVARRSQRHAGSAVPSGIQFSDDGPDERSPGCGKGGNEEAGKDDHDISGLGCRRRVRVVELVVPDKGVDEEADKHPNGAEDQGFAATDVLNNPEADDGRCDVDGAKNDGSDVYLKLV